MRSATISPLYTPAEEIANSITHGAGVLFSITALVILIVTASHHGDAWLMAGFVIFGNTLLLLYCASTLYHSIPAKTAKAWLKKLDHCAIYLLIAGTYTPFLLVHMRDALGWTLFGVIWGLAIVGIVLKLLFIQRMKGLSLAFYLFMGWLCLIPLPKLMHSVSGDSLSLLLIGGLLYTGGVVFYVWKKMPYHHAIWHLFVLGGSVTHFFSVLKSI